MSKTIIFDFDETIADTLDSVVRIVNNNAEYFGYKKSHKIRHFIPTRQKSKRFYLIMEYLYPNFQYRYRRYILKSIRR